MNVIYFVLVAAVLTFATGFFVASIVWSIKWLLSPKEAWVSSTSVHLLHLFSPRGFGASHNTNLTVDLLNNELYGYYHGKSARKLDQDSTESVVNNELFKYSHGRN